MLWILKFNFLNYIFKNVLFLSHNSKTNVNIESTCHGIIYSKIKAWTFCFVVVSPSCLWVPLYDTAVTHGGPSCCLMCWKAGWCPSCLAQRRRNFLSLSPLQGRQRISADMLTEQSPLRSQATSLWLNLVCMCVYNIFIPCTVPSHICHVVMDMPVLKWMNHRALCSLLSFLQMTLSLWLPKLKSKIFSPKIDKEAVVAPLIASHKNLLELLNLFCFPFREALNLCLSLSKF